MNRDETINAKEAFDTAKKVKEFVLEKLKAR